MLTCKFDDIEILKTSVVYINETSDKRAMLHLTTGETLLLKCTKEVASAILWGDFEAKILQINEALHDLDKGYSTVIDTLTSIVEIIS